MGYTVTRLLTFISPSCELRPGAGRPVGPRAQQLAATARRSRYQALEGRMVIYSIPLFQATWKILMKTFRIPQ